MLDLRSTWLSVALGALGASSSWALDDKAQSPVEVHEWSVWVGNPALPTWNSSRAYRNMMPSSVGTSRPKFEGKDLEGRFPVAPVSFAQFFGEPTKDVDVEVKLKQGAFLAHWPPSTERGGRLQWFKSDFLANPPDDIPPPYLPESHWFAKARDEKSALILRRESVYERFVAYDTELTLPIPLKIRGGPDEYTLQNLSGRRLLDVAVIAPTGDGVRVGWLDELPVAAPEKDKEKDKDKDKEKKDDPKKPKGSPEEKAEAVFKEPEPKKDVEEVTPLPAEGDANIRAQVDQQLNRPVTLNVDQAPRKEILDFITGQVRMAYELDTKTLAKANIDMTLPATLKANGIAARDALADLLGGVGLSYRVTETGKLYVTTAARLVEDPKKGKVVEGPPVKLAMSPPLKPSDPAFREKTRDTLARRLAAQGLRDEAVQNLLKQYGQVLFEPTELVVLAHLSREAIDDAVVIDVFPPPRKSVRTAMLVVHGVDPRLQDRAKTFVKQLGDDSYKVREAAEAKLLELGPVAVPSLEDALKDKDVEITFRAERLLLRLNRSVP